MTDRRGAHTADRARERAKLERRWVSTGNSRPLGAAIDAASGRRYWAEYIPGKIAYVNLAGGGGGTLNTTGSGIVDPGGVAIDPAGGRIYWANESTGTISCARLDGGGGSTLDTTGASMASATFPVLLETPRAVSAPTLGGSATLGSTLT